MHLDWSSLSLSGYYEGLEAHNEAHDPKVNKGLDADTADRLARFNAAHGVH